jgi:class 3 adenylate cyclase/predicted ATPase
MERCGQCGASLEAGGRFCGQCGAAVYGCPSCGAAVAGGNRFCTACGHRLADRAVPQRPAGPLLLSAPGALTDGNGSEPTAERRVCSVLFCDFVGFTPLSETRDPEAVRELLSRYFEVARTVVGRYGGVVEKFIGDAVMAVWGTPVAGEGDAERAVRAALDLVAAVAQLGDEAGVPGLAARAAVVTGEVAVTFSAPGEGMVAGDTVNTASRVQAIAEPGHVFVDAATQRLAGRGVGFAAVGEYRLKGKAEPVALWRATRVLSSLGGVQRVDGLEAPLVGRDAELRMVRELFHAACERRIPRLVLVSGPAGVGKSRLGWEFEKYLDGLAETVWWHRGRCSAYGDAVAFWALAEIIRQRLGVAEDESASSGAAKLAAGLDRFIHDPSERAYIGSRLGRLLGVAVADDTGALLSREELFAGWRLFFERLAEDAPVVLVVEDAQHADAGLLEFLDHLIDWARDLPIYVLVLARPELDLARPGFGTGRNRTTLTLDPLDTASMETLVDALVPDMPPAARTAVSSQAQGIPLFAVETVRSLIDRDVVQPSGGVYRLVGDVGELAVPDSLHALLAARLDALDPAVRRLVTEAAVLGTSFSAEALIAVSGRDERVVRSSLAELVRREVLSVSADPLSPERGSYRFAQQMLRQVAYDTLSRRDRKTRHLAVAAHLRLAFAGDGEEVTDVIARHYLDALDAVPDDPDADEIRGLAAAALVRAAQRATRTGAPALAAANYASAAQLHRDGGSGEVADAVPDAGILWERAAEAARDSGDYPAAISHAQQATDWFTRHGQVRAAAGARLAAGNSFYRLGRHADAREQLTAALEVLQAEPDSRTARALAELALLAVFSGSPDADRLSSEALILGQALDVDVRTLTTLFLTRAIFLATQDRRAQQVAYLRETVRLATKAEDNVALGRALLNLADAEMQADPAAAAEDARAAADHLRRAGASSMLEAAIANIVNALLMLGDWDGAEAELDAADADIVSEGLDYIAAFRGIVAALRGDAETAGACLDSIAILRSSDDVQDKATVSLLAALTAAAQGKPEQALKHATATIAHAGAIGMTHESVAWAWALAARAALLLDDSPATTELLDLVEGRPPGQTGPMLRAERDLVRARLAARDNGESAADAFAAAIRGLRERATPYHLAHGLLDYAEYLVAQGSGDAATTAVSEARDIATALRCQPLLDRAAALTEPGPRVPA